MIKIFVFIPFYLFEILFSKWYIRLEFRRKYSEKKKLFARNVEIKIKLNLKTHFFVIIKNRKEIYIEIKFIQNQRKRIRFKQISNKIKIPSYLHFQFAINHMLGKKRERERKSTAKRLDNSNISKVVRELPYIRFDWFIISISDSSELIIYKLLSSLES